MEFPNHNTKPVKMTWFEYIQKRCNTTPIKEYDSKPLSDNEVKKVYRNDFFRQDSNAYFDKHKGKEELRQDEIAEEYKRLKKEGTFDD